jgi:hypothetical protein
VYYFPYACQMKEHLKGWDVVYKVSSHGKLPVPNDEDYNLDHTSVLSPIRYIFYFAHVSKYIFFICAYLLNLNCRLLDKHGGRWDEYEEGEVERPQDGRGDTTGRRRLGAGGAAGRCRCGATG